MKSTPVVCPCCGLVSLTRESSVHTCAHCDTGFAVAAAGARPRP